MELSSFFKGSFSVEVICLLENEISTIKRLLWARKCNNDYLLKQALYNYQMLKFIRNNRNLFNRVDRKFKKEV